jgi:hypothetical protein
MGSDPKFPAGGEALRRHAAEVALATLRESGRTLDDTDPLVRELVDVMAYYDLPLSSLVAWIRHQPGNADLSTRLFTEHCQRLRNPHRLNSGGGYDAAADPHVCPQCHASPVQRLGAFWVCTSGRCAPRVAA